MVVTGHTSPLPPAPKVPDPSKGKQTHGNAQVVMCAGGSLIPTPQ